MKPKPSNRLATSHRKREHVDVVLHKDVGFRSKTTGFDRWEFEHNALPELNFSEINTRVAFLGKELALPLMIACMTGGYGDARSINRKLAEVCEESSIAMGVGSQRQAMEDGAYRKSFSVVREVAPTIPLIGNIGAVEVAQLRDALPVQRLIDLIRADALAVHLNPLQELLQPEGSPNFRGVLKGIELLVKQLTIPIIVKEIGAGISESVARRLIDIGVRIIDVAGAGGTSWAGVEIIRRGGDELEEAFWDWGTPTVEAIAGISSMRSRISDLTLIASGGIASGVHIAKSLALGADLAGSARLVIKALHRDGQDGVRKLIELWAMELKGVMFLVGAATVEHLKNSPLHRIE